MNSSTFGTLEVRQWRNRAEMGLQAAGAVATRIRKSCELSGNARVIFACAPSQNEFLAALVAENVPWPLVTIFHMDEYLGLDAAHPQSFRSYLREHLLERVEQPRAVHLIDGTAADAEAECGRYATLLAAGSIDLVCLGIGENGHLAFNDPPVAMFDDPALVKIVALDEACRLQQVHDGCFLDLDSVPRRAITLTIPTLLRAAHLSCVVPGERKAAAVRDTLHGPIATSIPASILRTHPSAVLHIDEAAAALL